jgi:hypothetical protein
LNLTDITNDHLSKCIDILQTSYIPSDKVLLTLNLNNLKTWLTGTNGTPILSFYNDITYTINENKEIIPKLNPIGCMISKPICFYYLEKNNSNKMQKYTQIPIYYWDYICVLKEHKQKNLSRKLIQTTEYIQRIRNPEFAVSLLKKELTLCDGIVPIVKYNSNTYYLRNIQIEPLPQHFTIAQITYTQNKDILLDFLGGLFNPDMPKIFEIIGVPSVTNILEMIKDFQLYCFCLKMGNNIYGIYFFKDENVLYEDIENGNTIHLIGSVNNSSSVDLFYLGFIHCIKSIVKQNRKRKKYEIIMIDETSHNKLLLNRWNQKFSKIMETPSAYYLYNFFYPKMPILPENCLILL